MGDRPAAARKQGASLYNQKGFVSGFNSGRADKTPFTVRRKHQAGADISQHKLGELRDNFRFRHAGGEIFQHRDAGIPNAGLA